MKITISKEQLLCSLEHCSSDKYRDNLQGVYFCNENKKIIATNGHSLVYFDITGTLPYGDFKSFTLSKDSILKALSFYKDYYKNLHSIDFEIKDQKVFIQDLEISKIDKDFPDYMQAIPSYENTYTIGITQKMLNTLSKMASKCKNGTFVLQITDRTDRPMIFEYKLNEGTKLNGVVMPVRL